MRILILCTANLARSQMEEGLMRTRGRDRLEVHSAGAHLTRVRPEAEGLMRARGGDRFEVHSAGAHLTRVRPEAVAVMAE